MHCKCTFCITISLENGMRIIDQTFVLRVSRLALLDGAGLLVPQAREDTLLHQESSGVMYPLRSAT